VAFSDSTQVWGKAYWPAIIRETAGHFFCANHEDTKTRRYYLPQITQIARIILATGDTDSPREIGPGRIAKDASNGVNTSNGVWR
jgi:hypothetical protein